MNPTTNTTAPETGPHRFFVKSIDDYTTHATLDDAIREVNELIQDCLCDGWDSDAVNAIEYGAIMGAAEMFNKRPDPTEDFAYLCEYQAAPLKDTGIFAAKGLNDSQAIAVCGGIVAFFDSVIDSMGLEINDAANKTEIYAFITSMLLTTATKKDAE